MEQQTLASIQNHLAAILDILQLELEDINEQLEPTSRRFDELSSQAREAHHRIAFIASAMIACGTTAPELHILAAR